MRDFDFFRGLLNALAISAVLWALIVCAVYYGVAR